MINNALHDASNIGAGTTIGGGLFLFFGENATAIGAMTVVFTAIVTLIFQWLNYAVNKRHKELDRRHVKEEILKELGIDKK